MDNWLGAPRPVTGRYAKPAPRCSTESDTPALSLGEHTHAPSVGFSYAIDTAVRAAEQPRLAAQGNTPERPFSGVVGARRTSTGLWRIAINRGPRSRLWRGATTFTPVFFSPGVCVTASGRLGISRRQPDSLQSAHHHLVIAWIAYEGNLLLRITFGSCHSVRIQYPHSPHSSELSLP